MLEGWHFQWNIPVNPRCEWVLSDLVHFIYIFSAEQLADSIRNEIKRLQHRRQLPHVSLSSSSQSDSGSDTEPTSAKQASPTRSQKDNAPLFTFKWALHHSISTPWAARHLFLLSSDLRLLSMALLVLITSSFIACCCYQSANVLSSYTSLCLSMLCSGYGLLPSAV